MNVLPEMPEHGGQVELLMRAFPDAPEPFIDLSTGISPYPYPFGEVRQTDLTRLPEQGEEERLLNAAMRAYGVRSPELIVAGSGTQLLISLLPYVLGRKKSFFLVRRIAVMRLHGGMQVPMFMSPVIWTHSVRKLLSPDVWVSCATPIILTDGIMIRLIFWLWRSAAHERIPVSLWMKLTLILKIISV